MEHASPAGLPFPSGSGVSCGAKNRKSAMILGVLVRVKWENFGKINDVAPRRAQDCPRLPKMRNANMDGHR